MALTPPSIIGSELLTMAAANKASRFVSNWCATRVPFARGFRLLGQKRYSGTLYREPKNLYRQGNSAKSLRAIPYQEPTSYYEQVESYEAEAEIREFQIVADRDDLAGMDQLGFNRHADRHVKRCSQIDLIERENRFQTDFLKTGVFGLDLDGNVTGNYINAPNVDPIDRYFAPMFDSIETGFGTLEDGHILRVMMTQSVWTALIANGQFQRRLGDGSDALSIPRVAQVLKSALLGSYDNVDRIDLQIRVAKATALPDENEGLQQSASGERIITGDKMLMVVAGAPNLTPMGILPALREDAGSNGNDALDQLNADFAMRVCMREYWAEDLVVTPEEDRLTKRMLFQARAASTFNVYDNTGGAYAQNLLSA